MTLLPLLPARGVVLDQISDGSAWQRTGHPNRFRASLSAEDWDLLRRLKLLACFAAGVSAEDVKDESFNRVIVQHGLRAKADELARDNRGTADR